MAVIQTYGQGIPSGYTLSASHLYLSTTANFISNESIPKSYVDSLSSGEGGNAGLTGLSGQLAMFSGTSTAIGLTGITSDGTNISLSGNIYQSSTGATSNNELITKAYVDSLTTSPVDVHNIVGDVSISGALSVTGNISPKGHILGNINMIVGNSSLPSYFKFGSVGTQHIGLLWTDKIRASDSISGVTFYNTSTASITADNQLTTKQYVDAQMKDSIKYIVATGSTTGDLHLSGSTWATSKANINYIRVDTSSTAWNMYLIQNANGYATNDAIIPALQIMNNGYLNQVIYLNHLYFSEDDDSSVHVYWDSSVSSSITGNLYIIGSEAK